VADVLRESPGISVKQGNGPRDIGISIRGSNARNGFAIRNIVIFEDGFPVTQPDGLSRSDLIDPRAYSAIDVIRGPSSALYGNYATGGALNFRTRPGRTIDGVEYGVDGGSFGYLTNYLTAGKKVGNFEYSLFTSDARGDGFIQNSWYNTQTVNFLGTLHATPDDRFTVKFINNNLETRLPVRLSLNQYYQNPFQQGCELAGVTGCGSVPLFINGFNGARSNVTAVQAGLGREDRRTIVGGRWEHDFDNTTTWRNQFVFDDRNISQPTGATSAIGDFPSYNYMSDITKRGEIFGMASTTYFGGWYNTLTASSDSVNVMPGGNAKLGLLQSNTFSDTSNYGVRARQELKINPSLTAVAGIGWETTQLKGTQHGLQIQHRECSDADDRSPITADRQFQNTAPEFALVYKLNPEWQFRGRVRHRLRNAAGRKPVRPFERQNGNNTQLRRSRTSATTSVRLDAEQCADAQRDRLLRILQERAGHAGHPVGAPMRASRSSAPVGTSRGRARRRLEVLSRLAFHGGLYLSRRVLHRIHREHPPTAPSSPSTGRATRFPVSRRTNSRRGWAMTRCGDRLRGWSLRRIAVEGFVLHGQRQSAEGARLRAGQSQRPLQDGSHFRLLQVAESVLRSQERVRPDICGLRQQHLEHGHDSRCTKPRERAGKPPPARSTPARRARSWRE
jgi:iron complex outermembrane receptor protein